MFYGNTLRIRYLWSMCSFTITASIVNDVSEASPRMHYLFWSGCTFPIRARPSKYVSMVAEPEAWTRFLSWVFFVCFATVLRLFIRTAVFSLRHVPFVAQSHGFLFMYVGIFLNVVHILLYHVHHPLPWRGTPFSCCARPMARYVVVAPGATPLCVCLTLCPGLH